MSILENLVNARLAVILDTSNGGSLGSDIGDAAAKAVLNGFGSPEWHDYMALFVDNKAQLDRLTLSVVNEDSYFPIGRAYIVSNGTCGADTDTFTGKGVKPLIEADLDPTPDGKIVNAPNPAPQGGAARKVPIPKIGQV